MRNNVIPSLITIVFFSFMLGDLVLYVKILNQIDDRVIRLESVTFDSGRCPRDEED